MRRSGTILFVASPGPLRDQATRWLAQADLPCVTAHDRAEARRTLGRQATSALVTAAELGDGHGLDLAVEARQQLPGLPVVLVDHRKVLSTAMRAVEEQVSAYLASPLDREQFTEAVRRGVEAYATLKTVRALEDRVNAWGQGLRDLERSLRLLPGGTVPGRGTDPTTVFHLTVGNIVGALLDLAPLCESPAAAAGAPAGGATADVYEDALREAIAVLEKTKGSFRSKELALLRRRLERCVGGGPAAQVSPAAGRRMDCPP